MAVIFKKAFQLFFDQIMKAQQIREENRVKDPVKAIRLSLRLQLVQIRLAVRNGQIILHLTIQ